jgi:hypothetical protein
MTPTPPPTKDSRTTTQIPRRSLALPGTPKEAVKVSPLFPSLSPPSPSHCWAPIARSDVTLPAAPPISIARPSNPSRTCRTKTLRVPGQGQGCRLYSVLCSNRTILYSMRLHPGLRDGREGVHALIANRPSPLSPPRRGWRKQPGNTPAESLPCESASRRRWLGLSRTSTIVHHRARPR